MTAPELAALARSVLASSPDSLTGRWPRAVALLTRQALEAAMDLLWARREPALAECSARAQLLCLSSYLGDKELAERAAWTWWALSQACHFHPYELAPTTAELEHLLSTVEQVAALAYEASPLS